MLVSSFSLMSLSSLSPQLQHHAGPASDLGSEPFSDGTRTIAVRMLLGLWDEIENSPTIPPAMKRAILNPARAEMKEDIQKRHENRQEKAFGDDDFGLEAEDLYESLQESRYFMMKDWSITDARQLEEVRLERMKLEIEKKKLEMQEKKLEIDRMDQLLEDRRVEVEKKKLEMQEKKLEMDRMDQLMEEKKLDYKIAKEGYRIERHRNWYNLCCRCLGFD